MFADANDLAMEIAHRMGARIREIEAAGRVPRVLLTGGTIAVTAYRHLQAHDADWANVEFWFGDERFIPAGLPDRNDRQAHEAFLDRVGATHVHSVADYDCSLSAAEAASGYAATLPSEPFDLALFGVGPDGHVASLFPGFSQLHETDLRAAAVFDSPKPPPIRVTLTYPALNHSDAVWFLVAGAEKAEAVARALAPEGSIEETPARGVTGRSETLWLVDEDAASKLRR